MRSSAGKSGDQNCSVTWADPSIDILAAARELAFRLALKAADPTNATSVSLNYIPSRLWEEIALIGFDNRYVYNPTKNSSIPSRVGSQASALCPRKWTWIAKLTVSPVTTPHQRYPTTKCPRLPFEVPLPRSSLALHARIRSLHPANTLRMVAAR